MGKKYITDELEVGGHMLDASMMTSLNTVVTDSANYMTTLPSHNHDYVSEGGTSFSGVYPMVVRVSADSIYSHPNVTFTGSSSQMFVGGSIKSPIFYDSNNTGYYVNPAGTSNFNVINATGGNSTEWNTAYDWGNHAGLYAAASHSHSWSSITGKPSTFPPSSHNHSNLIAVDDRDVKPNTSGVGTGIKGMKLFFSSLQGMTSTSNSDYQDLLVLDTWSDLSGGKANAITFDKSSIEMRLWQANHDATSWGTPQTVLHTGNFVAGVNYQPAGTYNTVIGTDSDVNTSGATIIDNLYMTDGVITSHGTRNLTLGDLGYTGATNANNYTHPSYNGDDLNVDTGVMGGATVISDLNFAVTTDTQGHVSYAGGFANTRTLTLANLGYTGATNANYITNNNQLTNGASYLTTSGKAADSNLLDGIDSGSFLRSDAHDTFTGKLSVGSTSTRRAGMYGIYDSNKIGHIWSMGTGFTIDDNGATFGNLYGAAYKHTNNTTGGTMGGGHQFVWTDNGNPRGSIGYNSVWHAESMKAPIFYDSNNTGYYVDPASTSRLNVLNVNKIHAIGVNSNTAPRWDTSFHVVQSQHWYGHNNSQTMYLGESSNPVRLRGSLRIGSDANADSGMALTVNGSANATSSFRAPIFYDSNNTAYYLDPYGYSNLQGMQIGSGDLKMYENGTYSSELRFQNNTHHMGIDYQNNETLRFITRSGTTTVPITFQMRAGTITAANFILSSDERKKTKIVDLPCDNIDVSWKSFEMKDNKGEYRTGVIAQELEQKHPEFVNTDDEGFKSVKYIDLLIAKIAELEARLEKLEK